MKILLIVPLCIVAALSACVSLTPAGDQVRVTSNPEVVHGCQFLGNVKATAGLAKDGLAASNNEKTLQNRTAKLGGNVLFEVQSGYHASGEAYRCEQPHP